MCLFLNEGDSKEQSASFRSVETSLDGSTLSLEESEGLLYSFRSSDNSNGGEEENQYRSPFKTTASIKFEAKVKTEKNAYVHDLAPFQRANGAMAAKFR